MLWVEIFDFYSNFAAYLSLKCVQQLRKAAIISVDAVGREISFLLETSQIICLDNARNSYDSDNSCCVWQCIQLESLELTS
jgi:hypothetical protein